MAAKFPNAMWCLAVAAAVVMSCSVPAEMVAEDVQAVVDGNTIFAVNLYHQLKQGQGNLFFSPHSLSTVLSMTSAGARGTTQEEMTAVLELGLAQEDLHAAVAALDASLRSAQGDGAVELAMANSLWPQRDAPFLDSFLGLTRESYRSSITPVDFARATEEARRQINQWVATETRDRIDELILPGQLDSATMLVLVNAIAFRGTWADQFDPEATRDAPFRRLDGSTVEVPLMFRHGRLPYRETDDLQIVELPFQGKRLSLFVILPREVGGLASVEDGLVVESLTSWLDAVAEQELRLFMPRLEIRWGTVGLREALVALGMEHAFDPGRADFSGMTGSRGLFVDNVYHQAFLKLDEQGAEAAAGSAVVMKKGMVPMVRVDHPFLLVIRDNDTAAILFMGRVVDPSA